MPDTPPLPVTERTRHRRLRDDGDSPDAALPVWAGVLPLAGTWLDPDPDPLLPAGIPVPPHIAALARRPLG
jgi:uncharacterized protein